MSLFKQDVTQHNFKQTTDSCRSIIVSAVPSKRLPGAGLSRRSKALGDGEEAMAPEVGADGCI